MAWTTLLLTHGLHQGVQSCLREEGTTGIKARETDVMFPETRFPVSVGRANVLATI